MASFTDTRGKQWQVVLTAAAARRVSDDLGFPVVDLCDPARSADAIRTVAADAMLAAAIVGLLIEPLAVAQGLSLAEIFAAPDDLRWALLTAVRARHTKVRA